MSTNRRHPGQEPLFWFCDICGWPHVAPWNHTACGVALDRWCRRDNVVDWINEPSRAVL
ncbi:hypothetical protein [Mycobacterium sp. 141]|uniref:hypothetical protein n=1 Tax=Mycobacterium sp. 141 TaxID=1120797 RepID=UPI000360B03A|nr:hypothetical protein [Mycobacterium sp. 141]